MILPPGPGAAASSSESNCALLRMEIATPFSLLLRMEMLPPLLLRLLGAMRVDAPRLYARISEARRSTGTGGTRDEFEFTVTAPAPSGAANVTTVVVRAMADVSVARLADLVPVEDDLLRRRVRVAEIDLRYRDQVIARLQ